MAAKLWRQGDLLIGEIEAIPAGAVRILDRVLARGEATGHRHRIEEGEGVQLYRAAVPWRDRSLYLDVTGERASVIHPEHDTIVLPTGHYRIWRQREFIAGGAFTVGD